MSYVVVVVTHHHHRAVVAGKWENMFYAIIWVCFLEFVCLCFCASLRANIMGRGKRKCVVRIAKKRCLRAKRNGGKGLMFSIPQHVTHSLISIKVLLLASHVPYTIVNIIAQLPSTFTKRSNVNIFLHKQTRHFCALKPHTLYLSLCRSTAAYIVHYSVNHVRKCKVRILDIVLLSACVLLHMSLNKG